MSCQREGTADVMPRRCSSCGELEHGSLACCVAAGIPIEEWPSSPSLKLSVTYRVMDDKLFVVDPGSPPRHE